MLTARGDFPRVGSNGSGGDTRDSGISFANYAGAEVRVFKEVDAATPRCGVVSRPCYNAPVANEAMRNEFI